MSLANRVVVTGLGVVSPLGSCVETFWSRLLAGDCGISGLKDASYSSLPSKVAGQVDDKQLLHSKKHASRISRGAVFAMDASYQALDDAKFYPQKMADTSRIGIIMGIGMVDLADIYNQWESFSKKGYNKVSPRFIPQILPNHISGVIALEHKITGMVHCVSTACATGAHAIGDAFRMLKCGELDAILVGAADSSVNPLAIAGFSRMRALATDFNDNPKGASRPYDKRRDGFVLSEGSAVMLLENAEYALARKAPKIYAELIGYGYSSDAHHISAPPADGNGALRAMTKALASARISADEVSYVAAHATSTPLGDAAEASAISQLFNNNVPPVSSIKGAVGHLLGAAGAIESVAAVLSIHHKWIPGTTGLEERDPNLPPHFAEKLVNHGKGCALNPRKGYNRRAVLKNSFGFYGANASLCFVEFSH